MDIIDIVLGGKRGNSETNNKPTIDDDAYVFTDIPVPMIDLRNTVITVGQPPVPIVSEKAKDILNTHCGPCAIGVNVDLSGSGDVFFVRGMAYYIWAYDVKHYECNIMRDLVITLEYNNGDWIIHADALVDVLGGT